MKKLTLFIVSIALLLNIQGRTDSKISCTIEIPANEFYIEGTNISPGDVVCLLAGDKDYLLLKDIQGTESQPITIINKGGAVVLDTDHFYGIKFDNCKHVIFSGDGENNLDYGIQVKRVAQGAGMSVDNRSTNIEIEYIEIAFTAIAGIYAKTEPYQGDCENLVTRENFTMYDLSIHDCYLHDITDEGLYIGSSKYTGQTVYNCDEVVVLPHIIEGVKVYNNIVENTGWDGIQVSSAPVDCQIYNNIIRNDSYAVEIYQMSGILIGGGSSCDCYNNQIYDGKGDGIDVFGMGFMKIYNNLIVRPGLTFQPGNPNEYKHGIYIGSVTGALSPGATFSIYNNTIISPKSFGITYNNPDATMGYIANNLITDPGTLDINDDAAYINLMNGNDKITSSNNYLSPNNTLPRFLSSSNDNYDLEPDSPAINYGISLTSEGITFDIENRFRPFHTYFDAGAYECHDPYAGVEENTEIVGIPYPIPANDNISIPVNSISNNPITIKIISLDGRIMLSQTKVYNNTRIININTSNIKSGNYIVNLIINNNSISKPILISK